MVLPKGPFWEYVEEMTDESRQCRFCQHIFSKLTPITRFKFHWSGVPRRGTTICEKVPELVREAAFAAVDGPPEKNHRITETSSNDGAQQEEALSVKELQERIDRLHVEVDNVAGDAGTTQAADRMGHAFGRSLEEFGRWLMEDAIENGTGGLVQPGAGASSSGGLTGNTNETPGDPLLASLHVEVDNVAPQGQHMERVTGQPVVRGSSHERPLVNHDEPQEDQLCPPLVNMVGNFSLDRVSSFPRDLIPGEQVEQECERNAQENLPLSVEDYRIEGTIMESSQLPVRGGSPERRTVNEDEPRGDLSQPTDPLCFGLERHYDQPSSSSVNNDVMMIDVENMIREHLQPVVRDSSREGLQPVGDESGRDVFLTEELIGGEFENNKNAIRSWIMNDIEASLSIGIYGRGGVGKTTLLTHIYNQLLQERGTYPHVHWITVSQDSSVYKLQNLIAKYFHLDLSNEDNERKRAANLSKALIEKQRWVLILDDLWDCFDYKKVGIPIKVKGCKLILTTRSFGVCQRMVCQKTIKVEPLSVEEAWALFMKVLGCIPPEAEEIAKSMARECAGLPLGIKTMAGTMRGVDDICEWRNALEELKQSRVWQEDMDEKVFHILRFSFMHLKESELQQCFLCCALFPEDFKIRREDLIAYLIDEGVIKGLKSREAEFNKGHLMLNKLERVCLLESAKEEFDDDRYVKMHDLVRDMAIQILEENSQGMVKAGARLREVLGAEEWTENLTRVSLMHNQIEKIPSTHSPRCPSLSTLLLCRNSELQFIADSFFNQLHGLKILDLSYTNITKLPNSISELVSLTALQLIGCKMLRHVPSLEKLSALRRLDFSRSWALEKMPQGMECLCNLRYLRMNGCGEKEFPGGLLPKLSHLQVFVLEEWILSLTEDNKREQYAPITVKGKEVGCLRKLETLECHFEGYSDYVEYLNYRDKTRLLTKYRIVVGLLHHKYYIGDKDKVIVLGNFTINRDGDFPSTFWNDIQQLTIDECNGAKSLCDVSTLIKNAIELEVINIRYCNSMESLVSSSWYCSASLPSPSDKGIFSGLKEFHCSGCESMKKLFPFILLPSLINLEVIKVSSCKKMEEIIGGIRSDEEGVMGEETSSNKNHLKLPRLRKLYLSKLPELKSICSAKLICDSLEVIGIANCENLKRMPICLPLLENGQPSPPPSLRRIEICPEEWWESVVKWEHPNTTDVLRPFVKVLETILPLDLDIKFRGQRRKGMGIVIQNDPEKVQDAARAAIDGPPEKKQKVIAGSSNNEVNNAIPTSAQEQNYEGRHVEMAQQGEAFSPTALKDCLDSIVDKEIELSINQADGPRGDSSSPKDLSCLSLGSYHDQLCSPSAKNDVIMDDVQNIVREKTEPVANMTEQSNTILNKLAGDDGMIQVGVQGREQGAEEELICSHPEAESSVEYICEGFIQKIDRNVSPERARLMENSSGRLVQPSTSASSTKLVGQAFEQNMKVIRSWLMDDEVSTIGIYGMGGVGKTTMLQHICNELLGRQGISQDVCWVTISQDFNIKKLQNLIAKCLDLDISSEDDDMSKTVKLAKELAKKPKWILIIDDLWNSFKPQEVGIPIPLKGSKLIMTTRSEMVCRQMNSQNNIRVDPLSDEESWTLFMEKLGQDKPLSPEVEQIAVDVARECAGLPLGIITLAKSLKGVDDLFEWRITLKRLKESNFWDMEDQIFQILRLSYDCLDDSAQQCFAYCALFNERDKIEREELIGSFIEEGIIKEMNNGHSILDRLEDVCLLERIDGGNAVKMHDLLRDMAMHILDEYSLIMG